MVVFMAKILFIIAQNGFRDEELDIPKNVLEKRGHTCTIASITTSNSVGKLGTVVIPDIAVSNVNSDEFDALVVVGGPNALSLMEYPEVISLIQDMYNDNKIVSAICIAGTILARAGITKGKRATVFKANESLSEYKSTGTIFVDQNVVVDGTIITANGPSAAEAFGNAISVALEE